MAVMRLKDGENQCGHRGVQNTAEAHADDIDSATKGNRIKMSLLIVGKI
jgi:hypothetical protein